jgi:hypothetical protein
MNQLKFNSQICTSVEQSNRLLELGLKPETADMEIEIFKGDNSISGYVSKGYWETDISEELAELIPAWSLHRLIEMCNKTQFWMIISIYNNEVTVDGALFDVFDNTYDNLISAIECLIKEGYFNKEYLKQ